MRRASLIAAVLLAAAAPVPVAAQSARDESVLRRPIGERPEGFTFGDFVLHPRLEVEGEYDDNVYRQRSGKRDDFVARIRPSVQVSSDWSEHSLDFFVNGEIARYATLHKEDYEAFTVGTRGRYDFDEELSLNGSASFSRQALPRGEPSDAGLAGVTIANIINSEVFLQNNGDPLFWRIGPQFRRVDYVKFAGGTNADYNQYWINSRIGYRVTEDFSVFVDPSYTWIKYAQKRDSTGFEQDSHGPEVRVGVAYEVARDITAEIGVGYYRRYFADSRLKPEDGVSVQGRLYWNPTETISVEADAGRGLTEFRAPGVAQNSRNAVDTHFGIRLGWLATDQVLVDGGVQWRNYHFPNPNGRTDNYYQGDVGARYYFSPYIYAGARYFIIKRDSSNSGFDYLDNRFMITIGGQL